MGFLVKWNHCLNIWKKKHLRGGICLKNGKFICYMIVLVTCNRSVVHIFYHCRDAILVKFWHLICSLNDMLMFQYLQVAFRLSSNIFVPQCKFWGGHTEYLKALSAYLPSICVQKLSVSWQTIRRGTDEVKCIVSSRTRQVLSFPFFFSL